MPTYILRQQISLLAKRFLGREDQNGFESGNLGKRSPLPFLRVLQDFTRRLPLKAAAFSWSSSRHILSKRKSRERKSQAVPYQAGISRPSCPQVLHQLDYERQGI